MLFYDTMFLILLGDIFNCLSIFELNGLIYSTESTESSTERNETCKQRIVMH